jgi:hypothetical protein
VGEHGLTTVETATSGPSALTEAAILGLKANLRGSIVGPGDAEYENERRVYNAMIERDPCLIARCCDVADVISAVTLDVRPDSRSPYAVVGTTVPVSVHATVGWLSTCLR